jgi:hypothetical protein
VAPEENSDNAEHSTITLGERLQEGFANGWAEGWRGHNFSKQTMNHAEINEICLWLKGHLMDRKWKPDQYKSSGKFKACRTKFVDPLSWKFLAYA